MTKEEKKEYDKRYRLTHKEEKAEYNREYYQANKDKAHEYYLANKEKKKEYNKKRYQANREKCAETTNRWIKNNPERKREINRKHMHKRHRNLGYNPLNKWFEGCEAHHINFNDVIYIPKEIHQGIRHNLLTGKNMTLINSIAYQFLMGNYIVYE